MNIIHKDKKEICVGTELHLRGKGEGICMTRKKQTKEAGYKWREKCEKFLCSFRGITKKIKKVKKYIN